MPRNFADRLLNASQTKGSCLLVGIDPRIERLPEEITTAATERYGDTLKGGAFAAFLFGCRVVDAVKEIVPGIKPQSAFFEAFGPAGVQAYADLARYAADAGLLVIADVKRNDIGTTAAAYAEAYLGSTAAGERPFATDALTVNPYLGRDGLEPFVRAAAAGGGGLFVLVRTSNESARDLQDMGGDEPVYLAVARMVNQMGRPLIGERGYSSVGAVVGATYPRDVEQLRRRMPNSLFLLPGFGAQGAGPEMVAAAFDKNGQGAFVSASRSILYAGSGRPDWQAAVARAAREATDRINAVRHR